MTQYFSSQSGVTIVQDMADIIIANRNYLSEIDGAIGDGDHGINMAKGFSICKEKIAGQEMTLDKALDQLSDTLMEGIGGSMGPLYGSLFFGWAEGIKGKEKITAQDFARMLQKGLDELREISDAQQGDKCLMDALIPAVETFSHAVTQGKTFQKALEEMKKAAESGRDSTKDMVAKIGRASRLGERSRGVLDAGAASCCLLLGQLAESIDRQLHL
ncbi:dihydroxyacetone kinase subunit DhaL [Entomobacter blattae]|uniref:PEP-dependent dihydroxyacetone kinase 2, ADP-binding subunit DhaL n=1 Tax=Entomobacter blattae TaxID=2762277 RepID=A0A7H1NTW5_9PROT|nr:dihydroxyacetone kinase subunit DhaL [Entomobacter blattae]QNT79225.1 PEP-dependent dihydroxyacetone kinase 2, ADP-binding subunit DhaL [Entomobacter blattae]